MRVKETGGGGEFSTPDTHGGGETRNDTVAVLVERDQPDAASVAPLLR